jgi:quercetin dioxygenase-like cupin family protein
LQLFTSKILHMMLQKSLQNKSFRKPENFTGNVWIQPLIHAPEPALINMYRVHFEPKSRTNWHSHPVGQILHIESGECWLQKWGEKILIAKPGDTVYIDPGEKHWHGASNDSFMIHIALQISKNNMDASWEEAVTDEQYYSAQEK